MKKRAVKGPARFCPEGELSIYTAAEQKQHLLTILDSEDAAELDLSGVAAIDTAGLQLLILARNEARRRQKSFAIVSRSDAVSEAISLCNLSNVLDAQVFIPSNAGEAP